MNSPRRRLLAAAGALAAGAAALLLGMLGTELTPYIVITSALVVDLLWVWKLWNENRPTATLLLAGAGLLTAVLVAGAAFHLDLMRP